MTFYRTSNQEKCITFHFSCPFVIVLSALRLIEFRGQAKSSSQYDGNLSAKEAFMGEMGKFWASSGNDPARKIWYQFEEAHSLAKIGFSSRSDDFLWQTPAHFLVIGSTMTDECTNWSTLLEVKKAGFTKNGEFRSWLIPIVNRKPFRCIGLKILSTIGDVNNAALKNVMMWE